MYTVHITGRCQYLKYSIKRSIVTNIHTKVTQPHTWKASRSTRLYMYIQYFDVYIHTTYYIRLPLTIVSVDPPGRRPAPQGSLPPAPHPTPQLATRTHTCAGRQQQNDESAARGRSCDMLAHLKNGETELRNGPHGETGPRGRKHLG